MLSDDSNETLTYQEITGHVHAMRQQFPNIGERIVIVQWAIGLPGITFVRQLDTQIPLTQSFVGQGD